MIRLNQINFNCFYSWRKRICNEFDYLHINWPIMLNTCLHFLFQSFSPFNSVQNNLIVIIQNDYTSAKYFADNL